MSKKEETLLMERARKDKLFTIRPGYVEACGAKNVLTGKFYSKYQAASEKTTPEQVRVYNQMRRASLPPREKFPHPQTENQCYGWYQPFIVLDTRDRRLCRRRLADPEIKLANDLLTLRKRQKMG